MKKVDIVNVIYLCSMVSFGYIAIFNASFDINAIRSIASIWFGGFLGVWVSDIVDSNISLRKLKKSLEKKYDT